MNTAPRALYVDPELGRIMMPQDIVRATSFAGKPIKRYKPGEVGIVVAKHHRPVYDDNGKILKMRMIMYSISHNERVDAGAAKQDVACFGAGITNPFKVIALGGTGLSGSITTGVITKAKTDLSLGIITANVTTNEIATNGGIRVAGTLGTYTAPASLGAQFSRVISNTFTASANLTAYASGIFDSATVSGSTLYVEDNFTANAVLVSGDTLTVSWTISN